MYAVSFRRSRRTRCRAGFTIRELLVGMLVTVVLLSIVLPTVASNRDGSRIETSMLNLMQIGVGQFAYAMDWNERQYAAARDELGFFGHSPIQALDVYQDQFGSHPPIILGWNEDGLWVFPLEGAFLGSTGPLAAPLDMSLKEPYGNNRLVNVKAVHDYVTGRFYDPVYYAPNDEAPYKTVSPLFQNPDEYIPSDKAGGIFFSSYCFSAAARFHPDVFRKPSEGGYQNPFISGLGYGLETPTYYQALHPDLKTQVMEHHWNQNAPGACNPSFDGGMYNDCEPYYFNHGMDSLPVALFYDGHVRILPNREAYNADAKILKQSGGVDGLWSRDTPLGDTGYYGEFAFDGTLLSHHMLTTDGIRGRDTLNGF